MPTSLKNAKAEGYGNDFSEKNTLTIPTILLQSWWTSELFPVLCKVCSSPLFNYSNNFLKIWHENSGHCSHWFLKFLQKPLTGWLSHFLDFRSELIDWLFVWQFYLAYKGCVFYKFKMIGHFSLLLSHILILVYCICRRPGNIWFC